MAGMDPLGRRCRNVRLGVENATAYHPLMTIKPTDQPVEPVRLFRHARLATMRLGAPWGWIEQGALITRGAEIAWVGREAELGAVTKAMGHDVQIEEVDLGGAVVTPGFIDPHTHLIYAGDRAGEFEQRLLGVSYEEIARSGGGIRTTVRATREASDTQLEELAVARARALLHEGVTTVEIKSGYGLSATDEMRSLRAARAVGTRLPMTVRTTSLALHAIPPEYTGRADVYVDEACRWLRDQHRAGVVDAVDAFCESIAFSPAQVARLFTVARELGLAVKLHAEQLSDSDGAALAASFGALSADHLEWLSPHGIAAMQQAGTVAVLLPGAFYFLRESRVPPIAALRAAGVPMALATDHNPGSSPTLSPLLMLSMAATLFRMTPEEAVQGMTVHAARALGLSDRGVLAPGMRADLAIWSVTHPRDLVYAFGVRPSVRVVSSGRDVELHA